MTQAPATPELVERLNEHVRYEYMPTAARLAMEQAAAALEAQQARIAELEKVLSVIANASERSETMFGGKMSEVTRVFQHITRVSRQALSSQGVVRGEKADG